MLSQSSQSAGFSYISHKQNYSPKLIDETIIEINRLGKKNLSTGSTRGEILSAIDQILAYMRTFSHQLQIQRVCCLALSTLSMEVTVCQFVVQKGGFQLIEDALIKFGAKDDTICWVASSAIWNLARSPVNRCIIGERGVKLMINILESHVDREKVINTAIGALANLGLHDDLKDVMTRKENLDVIMNVLSEYFAYRKITSVMKNGVALLANLAASDNHAETLISEYDITALLFELLKWCIQWEIHPNQENDTFTRNLCASLNNVAGAKSFLTAFLECNGVETIFAFLDINDKPLYSELLEEVLTNVGVDKNAKTSSLHLCCFHGRLDIIKQVIQVNPLLNLNLLDSKNMSLLDYAISMNHAELVHFLAKCGAVQYKNDYDQNKKELLNEFRSGQTKLNHSKNNVSKAIIESVPQMPTHLGNFMIQFSSNVDILQGNNQF